MPAWLMSRPDCTLTCRRAWLRWRLDFVLTQSESISQYRASAVVRATTIVAATTTTTTSRSRSNDDRDYFETSYARRKARNGDAEVRVCAHGCWTYSEKSTNFRRICVRCMRTSYIRTSANTLIQDAKGRIVSVLYCLASSWTNDRPTCARKMHFGSHLR